MKLAQRIGLVYYIAKFKIIELFSVKKAAEAAFEVFCTPYTKRKVLEIPPIFEVAYQVNFPYQGHEIKGFQWLPQHANGKKLLIVHGFDSYSYRFEKYIQPFLDEGFEVYAFDAPGHGRSTGKTINALLYKNMIIEAANLYGPFDGIMAHSFGGIALALAAEQLQDKLCKRMVLIAPATETTRSVNDFARHLKLSPELKQALEDIIMRIGGNPSQWFSVARAIKNITIPTLWLHDRQDNITPYEDMHAVTELGLRHIEFVITEGLGHSLYRDEAVAARIVQFFCGLKQRV